MKLTETVDVYMCLTDARHHVPDDSGGIQVFFSEEDLKTKLKCTEQCGIAKGTLTFTEVLKPFSW